MGILTSKSFLAACKRAVAGRYGAVANRCAQRHSRHLRQSGSALFIALIVLVAMTLAAISLVRSVDTANVIAGNFAFKQAAIQASDMGVEAAFTQVPTIIANSLDTVVTPVPGGTTKYWYYPTMRELDVSGNGAPTVKELGAGGAAGAAINWSGVPIASSSNGYNVQYVIDRLCQGPPPVTDIQGKCFTGAATGAGSKKAGSVQFTGATSVHYRATVRVSGPRNTVSMVQVILSN